jgi:hypothetical protein
MTVMSTMPVPAGDVAVIEVALLTVNELAAVLPNFTAVAPVKLAPVMATLVPPVVGPLLGETDVTVGGLTVMVAVLDGAPGPVASEVIGPVVLLFTPVLVAVTLTVRVQLPGEPTSSAPRMLLLPGGSLATERPVPPRPDGGFALERPTLGTLISVAPERLMLLLPGVAATVPPQLLVRPLAVETTRPAGSVSVKPIPVSDTVLVLGLLIEKDRVVLPPTAMEVAPNESLIVGGDTAFTVRIVVFEVAPGPL